MTVRRYTPLSGIALVALIVLAVALGGSTPGGTDAGAKVAAYYDAHQARMVVISFLFTAAGLLAILFASAVARALGAGDDGHAGIWDRVLLGGGVLFASALGVVGAMNFAIADSPNKVSHSALQAINLMLNDSWVFWNAALGVLMLGAAGVSLATGRQARWIGCVALVLGIALFIPFADFFSFLASGLWIIGTSVQLYRREQRRPGRAAAPSLA
jgi:hypothetical protein